jgi:DNA-binding winged helix-turn-helix (wHTH) protein/serine/threonine protein kinase
LIPENVDQVAGGRVFRFADCEFNESSRELRVRGQLADLESKPLEILHQLLVHAGEVVTREELFESVWPGTIVVDGSLATAVSKLRKVLGAEQALILTIPRIGYRLAAPVQTRHIAEPPPPSLDFREGQPVPGREHWILLRRLDASSNSEVWLGEQPKTRERRVFKFAIDGQRLKALKREATVARFINESLGERTDFVRVLEWNFEHPPFYLETEYGGQDLRAWAEVEGGLGAVPIDVRLRIVVDVAKAVAAAHEIGILHKDLKPENILIAEGKGAPPDSHSWVVRVADFGSASLLEPARLKALGITNLGFTQSAAAATESLTGTLMYIAPEVLAGHSPTASADIYALGVLLYQMMAGDFRTPLSPGWESSVEEPLIREDIAEAASGDPARRLGSAALLVRRLESLEQRRTARSELDAANERAKIAEHRVARARVRRPWIFAAVVTLAIGLGASLGLYRAASLERDRANRQTAIADSESRFLVNDLLGRANPFTAGASDERLIDAINVAAPAIERRFSAEPEVSARLHAAIARALDNRTDYRDALPEYARAAEMFRKADGPLSQDAIITELQQAAAEARSYEKGSLPGAKSILADQERRIQQIQNSREDVRVWLANARGMVNLIDNNIKPASAGFGEAFDRASRLPEFDETSRLLFKQRLAFTYIRLGDGVRAERAFRELIAAFSRIEGKDSPNVLRVRLNLAQAFMIEQKNREAVAETTAIYPAYVARLGDSHELSMQVLTTRAQSEGSLSLWNDAIQDDLRIYHLAVRKQGPASFFAVAALSDAGLAQCRAGRLAEGESNARMAYEASTRAFGARAGLTGGTAHTFASCLIELNRLDEAGRLLGNIDADAVGQLVGSKDWSANVQLSKAEIAFRRHDYELARKYVVAATPGISQPNTEPYQKAALSKLTAALR